MNIERFVSNGLAKKVLFYLLAAFLGGCIPVMSLHSLYTKEDVVFEKKLLGTWVDDPNNPKNTWEFSRIEEPENAYILLFYGEEGKKGSFIAHLVKLKNRFFLDVYPSELPWEPEEPNSVKWLYNSFFLIPVHTFIKIEAIEPQLKMRFTDDDEKMRELLKEDPNAVKHTLIEDRFLLTATTKELQGFVIKYADDVRLFPGEIVLLQRKAKVPSISKAVKP